MSPWFIDSVWQSLKLILEQRLFVNSYGTRYEVLHKGFFVWKTKDNLN